MPSVHRRRPAGGHVGDPAGPDLPRAARRLPRRRWRRPPRAVTAGAPTTYDAMLDAAELVPHRVRVQPRRPARATATRPSRRSCASASATASSSPATFAAMARSLGIPARVAVGFTPGPRPGRRHAARCSARTPTPGRRSGSTVSAGCRSSRRRAAARRAPRRYTGLPAGPGRVAPAGAGDGRREAAAPATVAAPVAAEPQPIDDPEAPLAAGAPRRPARHARSSTGPARRGGPSASSACSLLGALLALPERRAPVAPAPPARRRRPADRRPVATRARRASRRRASASTRR